MIRKHFFVRFLLAACVAILSLAGCKPSDEKIQKQVTEKLAPYPGVTATVKEGVVSLAGEVRDEATKTAAETAVQGTENVKSVVNSISVAAPAPAPVQINPDDTLAQSAQQVIAELNLKDVNAGVADGVITLTGTVSKNDLPKLMQRLQETKPKRVVNNLTVK